MRLLSGLSLLALAFFASHRLADAGAGSYYNMPALVLIILCPIAVAIISHDPKELWRDTVLAWRSLRGSEAANKQQLSEDFSALSVAQRQHQRHRMVQVTERSHSDIVVRSGELLLKSYDRPALRESFVAFAQNKMGEVRRAEELFLTMARAAPAFGLIGTILGFIDLLKHMKDADSLGGGMAMALSATLYGISLSYCFYNPLAKSVATYGRKLADLLRASEQAMLLIHDGRATHDVAQQFATESKGALHVVETAPEVTP
jgi:chemotaxis protein MotA